MIGAAGVRAIALHHRKRVALVAVVAAAFLVHPSTSTAQDAAVAVPRIEQNLWVPSSVDSDNDGHPDLIHFSVTRPAASADGPVPAVVFVTGSVAEPGAAEMLVAKTDNRRANQLLADGFAVVRVDNPGIGASRGCTDTGGPIDVAAGSAVIGFLSGKTEAFADLAATEVATSEWSTGEVALVGGADSGAHPLAFAGASGLAAIVSIDDVADGYAQYRSGGAALTPGVRTPVAGKKFTAVPAPAACADLLKDLRGQADAGSGDHNAFWASRNYLAADKLAAAVLILQSTGQPKVSATQAVAVDRAAAADKIAHQLRFVVDGAAEGNDALISGWLRSALATDSAGPASGVVTVERAGEPTVVDVYASWPAAEAENVRLAGTSSGVLIRATGADEPADDPKLVAASNLSVATVVAEGGPSLLTTPELTADLRLSGVTAIELRVTPVASDDPQNPLTAVLLKIAADGGASVVAAGGVDLSNPKSDDATVAPAAGEPMAVKFDLHPADAIVAKGSRLAVALLGAEPVALSDDGKVSQTAALIPFYFDPAATVVDLPVVGGTAAADEALAVVDPQTPGGTGPSAGETTPGETTAGETTAGETSPADTSAPVETTAPSTEAPSSEAPSSEAPSSEAPSTEAPSTQAPSSEGPETESSEEPTDGTGTTSPEATNPDPTGTEAVPTETSGTETSSTEISGTETSATETSSTDVPGTDVPTTDSPPTDDPDTDSGVPGETPTPGGFNTMPKPPSWQAAVSAQRHSVIPKEGFFMTFVGESEVDLEQTALSGKDQIVTGTMSKVRINDGRVKPAQWNLTGQVSDFRSANGVILAENLGWVPVALPLGPDQNVTVDPGPIVEPGKNNGLGTFRVLCSSDQAVEAVVDCGGTLQLGVPSSSRTGEYTATLTLTLI